MPICRVMVGQVPKQRLYKAQLMTGSFPVKRCMQLLDAALSTHYGNDHRFRLAAHTMVLFWSQEMLKTAREAI